VIVNSHRFFLYNDFHLRAEKIVKYHLISSFIGRSLILISDQFLIFSDALSEKFFIMRMNSDLMAPVSTTEKILLHLYSYRGETLDRQLSPQGISRALREEKENTTTLLEELIEEDLVRVEENTLPGSKSSEKFYFLTDKGLRKAEELKEDLKGLKITLIERGEKKEIELGQIEDHLDTSDPILDAATHMDDERVLHISKIKDRDIFADREEEMETLKNTLDEVKKGRCRSIFIEGEVGIGKTRLVSEFRSYARKDGFDFLLGEGKKDSSEPYHPFKEAFKVYLENTSTSRSPIGGSAMALLGTETNDKEDLKGFFDSKKEANFHESAKWIKELSTQNPLVIFLDDIHQADKATVELFSYLSNRIESKPILFIVTYSLTEVSTDHPLANILHRAIGKVSFTKIEVSPLEREHTSRIVKDVLEKDDVPGRFIKFIHKKVKGNPLFAKESIKHMLDEGAIEPQNDVYPSLKEDITVPDVIQDVIERRITQLDSDTKRILQIGSVIGDRVPFSLIVKLSDSEVFKILDHIDILLDSDLWYEEPGEEIFHFSHGLVRDAVLDDMKDLKRNILHERVADLIREDGSIDKEERYSKLAYHYRKAGKHSKALEYYIKAGKRARRAFAYEDSIGFYRSSLEMIENSEEDFETLKKKVLEKLGDLFRLTERYDESKETFERLYADPVDKTQKEQMYRKIGAVFLEMGDLEKALEYIEKGLDQIEGDRKERCRLLELKGWIYLEKEDRSKAFDIFKQEKSLAEREKEKEILGEAINELGSVVLPFSEAENPIDYLLETLEVEEKGSKEQGIQELSMVIREDLGEEKILERALDIYEGCANLRKESEGHKDSEMPFDKLGVIYKTSSDILDQALHYYGKSLSICRQFADRREISVIYYHMGLINQKKGDLERSIRCYESSLEIIDDWNDLVHLPSVLEKLGTIHREKGDLEKAVKYHEKALDLVDYEGRTFSIRCEQILDAMELGDIDDAVKMISDLWVKAQADASRKSLIKCRWVAGKAYRKKGELSEAKSKLEDGLNMCGEGKNDVDKAKILYERGLLKKKEDDRDGGKEDLKKACEIFAERRMSAWEKKCKEELKNI